MAICDVPLCIEHYGCRLRKDERHPYGGDLLQVDTRALPNRRHALPRDPRKISWIGDNSPSWEAGIAGERRAGGAFMPYLDREGQHIPVKAFGEGRHRLEAARRQIAQEVPAQCQS